MAEYAIYLRKSRADVEAEARGEGETLARHRAALMALADREGMHVARVYQEIVSGDTIDARPQMQALLAAVQEGQYAGVICNDIDRLSRGNMADQAAIQQAFMASGTLIITPQKIYNPLNDVDSDFFDMSLFMARFEYKQIKKRMQTGRIRSAAEGNWQSGKAPYGYTKVRKEGKSGYTLQIIPDEAEIVRTIYDMTLSGKGRKAISTELYAKGISNRLGKPFAGSALETMIKNPVYKGDFYYQKRKQRQIYIDGHPKKVYQKNDNPVIATDVFPAIITRQKWEAAQQIMKSRAIAPATIARPLQNPLAGIIRCARCGKIMHRVPTGSGVWIACETIDCGMSSAPLNVVESAILDGLKGWTIDYSAETKEAENHAQNIYNISSKKIEERIATLESRMEKLYDFLEQGIYSPQEFLERRAELTAQKKQAEEEKARIKSEPSKQDIISAMIPQIKTVLDAYPYAQTAEEKNRLLKAVLEKAEYSRDNAYSLKNEVAKHISIRLYPKLLPNL